MIKLKTSKVTEEDIRPAKLMKDKEYSIELDRQLLLSSKNLWVNVKCPACDTAGGIPYGEKFGFNYTECEVCGTVYTNPRPSSDLVTKFYKNSKNYEYWNQYIFPVTESVRRKKIFRPRARFLKKMCIKNGISPGTLLEVGAGFGIFCEEIARLNFFKRVIALEPSKNLSQTCREKGFDVIDAPIEYITGSEMADVITAFEVIEHLFDPRQFATQCHRLLRKKGLLLLTCPNLRGFDVMSLKTLSNSFDHEHLNYFHTESLPRMLRNCGFEILEVTTPGKLDADIVRKYSLRGDFDLSHHPFLKEILIERWDEVGEKFQDFLAKNRLSSHMWVTAQRNI